MKWVACYRSFARFDGVPCPSPSDGRLDAKVFVKPVGENFHVLLQPGPAVTFALAGDQLGGRAKLFASLYKSAGLIDRHELVRVAMHDQNRRQVRTDKINRGSLATELLAFLGGIRARAKGRFEIFKNPDSHSVLAFLAVIEEIRWRKKAGDALDFTAFTIHGILGFGVAGGALRPHGE